MSGEDDLLERATRALRETPPLSEEELRVERAVLMRAQRAATQKRRSKSRALRWVLPLAAVLTAGSALAATTGQLERAVQVVATWLGSEPPREARTKQPARPRREARRPSPAVQEQPQQQPPQAEPQRSEEPPPAAPQAASRAPEPVEAVRSPAPAPRRPEAAPARTAEPAMKPAIEPAVEPAIEEPAPSAVASDEPAVAAPNPDLLRYREAHRLHFRERDMWAALKAWESYLSTYPNGTFTIEARYNRAICLVRLGRKEEARRALAPFAAGEIGRGYRRAEASELLKALE